MHKLHIGSGNNYLKGFINIDRGECKCDKSMDFEYESFPYMDGEIEYILAENILVMVKNTKHLMNECHRVLSHDGTLELLNFDAGKYPHLFFQDPMHERGFTKETYKYFCEEFHYYRNFGTVYGFKPWKLISMEEEGQCLRVKLRPKK